MDRRGGCRCLPHPTSAEAARPPTAATTTCGGARPPSSQCLAWPCAADGPRLKPYIVYCGGWQFTSVLSHVTPCCATAAARLRGEHGDVRGAHRCWPTGATASPSCCWPLALACSSALAPHPVVPRDFVSPPALGLLVAGVPCTKARSASSSSACGAHIGLAGSVAHEMRAAQVRRARQHRQPAAGAGQPVALTRPGSADADPCPARP